MKTREEWLLTACKHLRRRLFKRCGYSNVPTVKISVGWPYGKRGTKTLGEHWTPLASTDSKGQIFISPIIEEPVQALDVLVHEMCHAAVGNEKGHGPDFRRCAMAVGLVGKMRSASAGPLLIPELKVLAKTLGRYPHGALTPADGGEKKQTTRMLKMQCEGCAYVCRASSTHIEEKGLVLCPNVNCEKHCHPMQIEMPKL